MSRSWEDSRLLEDEVLTRLLPSTLRDTLLEANGATYLAAVARAALVTGCTERVFVIYENLFPDTSSRWLTSAQTAPLIENITTLDSFTRIYPFAKYLGPLIKEFFIHSSLQKLQTEVIEQSWLQDFLIGLFRLLSTDQEQFSDIIKPTFLSRLLSHDSMSVRYLAIQCLCMIMRFVDSLENKLIQTYIGDVAIPGTWEGKQVDFRLLKLLEEKRWMDLEKDLHHARQSYRGATSTKNKETRMSSLDLSSRTVDLGGVLVNRDNVISGQESSFIATSTAVDNMGSLGRSLIQQQPVLLLGKAGSGKSTLVQEAARRMGQLSSMITLYLNEQTDAKSLLGLYTSSKSGESFVWQPGVLTKAVQQGRWVLIEDVDKAPSEVLGVLRPIIENGELWLPSRKETVRPKDGFRVFATIRTTPQKDRVNSGRHSWLTNDRTWHVVPVQGYSSQEIAELLKHRYPAISLLVPSIHQAHDLICEAYENETQLRAFQGRLPSLRDLLKWCRRTSHRVQAYNQSISTGGMPAQVKLDIFKDGLDCYAMIHSNGHAYQLIAERIAQALNVSPQQMNHVIAQSDPVFINDKTQFVVGRSRFQKLLVRKSVSVHQASFAMTSQALRTLDSIMAATTHVEPLLLVGETGVGKTSQIQYVANQINQRLTVVNLSQQSEAADLLGGLKPITTRSLIMPIVDQFNGLFDETFSTKRNKKFQDAISKSIARENWNRLVLLWQEAVKMAEDSLGNPPVLRAGDDDMQTSKRRKIISKYEALRHRWSDFSSKLSQIQVQIEKGDKNHTFAFIEGRLVEAVRRGEWLLLDEINLASADTLDHIVGLLGNSDDEKPSLLLTEAGDIERIIAHPNFRIFAAMNPATDTGKRDLAPGVRARFTEIYVSSGDDDMKDLVQIIEVYLGAALSSDKRAASDLARAYLQLKKLNEEHKLTDGAGDVPHFSIRTLVRSLLYVIQHSPRHGLRRSMYEGFAMSFFTMLSFESENLVLPLLRNSVLSHVKNPKAFMSQRPKISYDAEIHVAFEHHIVRRGTNTTDLQPHYIVTPSVKRNLINLARAASMHRFPILLQGPTSAGKTSMVEYLAKYSGNEFVRINNHEHTDLQEYLGSYATGTDGKLEFREGVLVEALRKGHWIVLDELNLAPSDVLEALNRLLDDNRELLIPESQEIVRPHPNFMLFATQNPAGLYGGRKRLSRAFRNRFLEIHFDDIPEDELGEILRERSRIAPSYCGEIVQVYKKLSLQRQSTRLFEAKNSFATLRDLFRWSARSIDNRQQLAEHGFMLLAERVRDTSERQVVKSVIEETMKVKINEDVLYGPEALFEAVRSHPDIVWTAAMRRLFVLISESLKNDEPILLVGETGCGKTQICQTASLAFGRELSIYNAHSNTETGDLIGSQRPIRQRSGLATALVDSFNQLYASAEAPHHVEDKSIGELINDFAALDTSNFQPDAVQKMKQSIAAYQSLFEWSDGSLVRAMKSGQHFLLDEISLADDSVLERLNSVLEPSRTILLAEKGTADSLVVAHSNFQFLATMNPGGDYGKRELSAALRNRLTEIWVPPLSHADDILPIIQSKLGKKIVGFAKPMLEFAVWFKDNIQSSTAATIPLRNLLAWTKFMRTNEELDSRIAFVQGAAMVYVDSLGANPAGLTSVLANNIEDVRSSCLEKLQVLAHCDAHAILDEVPALKIMHDRIQLGSFSIPRSITEQVPNSLVFDAPTTRRNTMRIVRALQMQRPILLEGNPGVGKTAIVTALASLVGKHLTRINLSDQTDLMDLFGADTPSENEEFGRFAWRDGPLLRAMQTGGWVLLDEMNLASQSVLEGLNSCLDHRKEVYIAELDKSFVCHPDFTLFAAQNPHHQGGGRKGLPASFVNRFTIVYADPFERDDLMMICKRTRPEIPEEELSIVIDTVFDGQKLLSQSTAFGHGGPWELNLRDVNRWLDLCQEYRMIPTSLHFETVIAQRFRSSHAILLLEQLRNDRFGHYSGPTLYHNLSQETYQLGTTFLNRESYLQHIPPRQLISTDHLPYAKSAITAINHGWPLILTGPSGCGKTALIRNLAAMSGAKLVEFSMNADIDTMDLIGGFEQYDPRRDVLALQKECCELLIALIHENLMSPTNNQETFLFMAAYERCTDTDLDVNELARVLDQLSQRFELFAGMNDKTSQMLSKQMSSRFVWNDGILIDAVQGGSWLVLDNANLCKPSVLDRLNSLLEPEGVLMVSEQHNGGEHVRIIKPHPNFRIFLTMDPKYGELSRAMRNRSLELSLGNNQSSLSHSTTPLYAGSSETYRLRNILQHASVASVLHTGPTAIDATGGTLSHQDMRMAKNSLYHIVDSDTAQSLSRALALYASLPEHMQTFWTKFIAQSLPDLECKDLPQMFAINDPLLWLVEKNICDSWIKAYSRQSLYEVQRLELADRVDRHVSTIQDIKRDQMTILQKSVHDAGRPKSKQKQEAVPNLYGFLTDLMRTATMADHPPSSYESVTWFYRLVSLADDIFQVSAQHSLDHGKLQAYIQIARRLSRDAPPAHECYKGLQVALSRLSDGLMLQSGRSLQRLWLEWKPTTAASNEQLMNQISTENLLAKFDRLARTLPHRRRDLASIRSRLSDAFSKITSDVEYQKTILPLSDAIEALSKQNDLQTVDRSHFAKYFTRLQAKLVVQGKKMTNLDFHSVSLFASPSSVVPLEQTSSLVSDTLRRLAYYNSNVSDSIENNGLKLSIAVNEVVSVPLSSLSYVRDELCELAVALSRHAFDWQTSLIETILNSVAKLLAGILRPHVDLFSMEAQLYITAARLADFTRLAVLGENALKLDETSEVGYFKAVYLAYFVPVITVLSSPDGISSRVAGSILVSVCIGALHLFVPDKAFDPAIYPALVSHLHQKRREELISQIAMYKQFQIQFTGQESSMIISILENDLTNLGEAPRVPSVVRPAKTELHIVQDEFSTLIRSILELKQYLPILEQMRPGLNQKDELLSACQIMQKTSSHLIPRLSKLNRAYDDIVKPVAWLLASVSLGSRLVLDDLKSTARKSAIMVTERIPLLGGQPQDIVSSVPKQLSAKKHVDLQWLENVVFRGQVQKSLTVTPSTTFEFMQIVDKFYVEWKTRLTKDQAESEARSKYYTYKGGDENAQNEDQEEIASLFPTYDQDLEGEPVSSEIKYDARGVAICLSKLHEVLHNTGAHQRPLDDYIKSTLETFQNSDDDTHAPSLSDLLSGILLQIDGAMSETNGEMEKQNINIYADSDMSESRKLIKLVQEIRARFDEISQRWPEHATPAEVLAYSKELLAFSINDPIAKLMTKTEKLLDIVAQWQSVASREWSVSNLVEGLTGMIIHWRRRELQSWSKLLDLETRKNEEDARAWYFIAYEAVIYNSMLVIEQTDDVQPYCLELTKALEDFLRSATLGQYETRLDLLSVLNKTLQVLSPTNARLISIAHCVAGVVFHYQRYQTHVRFTLSKGREKLEKDISEQIKLASWKDTNIQSLKDSARRSHHKLFKTIKKYRALLAQPISSFTSTTVDVEAVVISQAKIEGSQPEMIRLQSARQRCAAEISDWQSRTSRWNDPATSTMSIKRLFENKIGPFSAFEELSALRSDIASMAGELRKQTPQSLTEDNKGLVRHLKERKRRLFIDTLKTLTQMGVRRNIATVELEKQSTVPIILSHSSDIDHELDCMISAQVVNDAFHEVLDQMVSIRGAVVEHSDDLTDGETRRGVGLLEGLLSIQIRQRAELSAAAAGLKYLKSLLDTSRSISSTPVQSISILESDVSATRWWVDRSLVWLPHILGVACKVLKFQSKHGELDLDELIAGLETRMQSLEAAKVRLDESPELPKGLCSLTTNRELQAITLDLNIFDQFLERWQSKEPNIAYLLRQIVPWTRPFGVSPSDTNGILSTNIDNIDNLIRRLLDSIFIIMQNTASIQSRVPTSTEDVNWLKQTNKAFAESINSLHLHNISKQLKELLASLHHLPPSQLELGNSILTVACPVIHQYFSIARYIFEVQLNNHFETCRLAIVLTRSFASLVKEGFCSPREPSTDQEQQSNKLESGTGLGDGEGAEDISKDIGDDEDLSELAQAEAGKTNDDQHMDKEKDAVDMGADDLDGAMGSGDDIESDDDKDDKQSGSDDEDGVDEEVGSVDDLDPSAVNEKLWDDMRAEAEKEEKEMKSEKQKGEKSDEQTAKQDGLLNEENEDEGGAEEQEEGDSADENEEVDGQGRPEAENLDPHLQEEDALELPEDMQLNGDDGKDDEISNDGIDELSDIDVMDQPQPEQVDDVEGEDEDHEKDGGTGDSDIDNDHEDEEIDGKAQDDLIVEDQDEEDAPGDKEDNLDTRENEMQYDLDDIEGGHTGAANQKDQPADQDQSEIAPGQNDEEEVANEQQTQSGKGPDQEQTGDASRGTREQGIGRDNEQRKKPDDAVQKLADILEQFYQRREIFTASDERKTNDVVQDIDMADADFEHLAQDDDQADTQALGTTSTDQAQRVDESKAIEAEKNDTDQYLPMPEDSNSQDLEQPETIAERLHRLQAQSEQQDRPENTVVVPHSMSQAAPQVRAEGEIQVNDTEEDVMDIDTAQQQRQTELESTSTADAMTLWNHCSRRTHTLSLLLTEQLRLILAPTTATKLRGDFRTGKRLNIKRIIPYIASGYKRDKIWMRRSVPSKRNYQVMIAVDDSKSMSESGADLLAFETLAMLSKSLSTLEVGDICIVGFGDEEHVRVAHAFGQPFTGTDSGVEVFRSFTFQQRGTDVKRLLRQSLTLFEEARLRSSPAGGGGEDLWQLQLIVSDGQCSDHEAIRRLVRVAHDRKIIIVFVLVDAGPDSVLDVKTASFQKIDPNDPDSETRVVTRRYLEDFPFGYYIVVRDVSDLPGVLARVLKGWFESVVNVG